MYILTNPATSETETCRILVVMEPAEFHLRWKFGSNPFCRTVGQFSFALGVVIRAVTNSEMLFVASLTQSQGELSWSHGGSDSHSQRVEKLIFLHKIDIMTIDD